MDEFRPGEVPTDPEAYQALLKRWGLDDETLGMSTGQTDSESPSDEPSSDADDPAQAEPAELAQPQPAIDADTDAGADVEEQNLGLGFLDESADEDSATLSAAERKQRRIWLRRSLLAVGVVLSLILGVAGFYVVVGLQALQGIKRDPSLLPTDDGYQTVPPAVTGPLDFVLIGSDSRSATDQGRSDSLMLAHLNSTRDTLYLISFPRDMYVEIPGHGKNKINAAYSFGGPALTVKTLQNLVGTRMDHTVMIDFDGFIGLTSDVGGVTVFNEVASSNLGYNFPRGDITISGEQALAYVRERYDLPNGDLDRAERQRNVVKALILKLMKPSVMANPATFNNVANKLGRYVTVDNKLTNDVIWDVATDVNIRNADGIRQIQAPLSGFKTVPGVGSVDVVDTARMAELADAIQNDTLGSYWAKYGSD